VAVAGMTDGKRSGVGIVAAAGLAVAAAAALYFMASGTRVVPQATPPGDPRPAPAASVAPGPEPEEPPLLEIGAKDWTWERSDGEAVVSGQVRNVSGHRLANLVAEVSFYDAGGAFITSAEAFIFPSLVEPGQTVRFEVREPWNPDIKDARLSFQELFGYPVRTRWAEGDSP